MGGYFDIIFDACQLTQFAFDDDAMGMSVFDDLLGQGDVIFERMLRSVNHDGCEPAIYAGFARFKIGAVI